MAPLLMLVPNNAALAGVVLGMEVMCFVFCGWERGATKGPLVAL